MRRIISLLVLPFGLFAAIGCMNGPANDSAAVPAAPKKAVAADTDEPQPESGPKLEAPKVEFEKGKGFKLPPPTKPNDTAPWLKTDADKAKDKAKLAEKKDEPVNDFQKNLDKLKKAKATTGTDNPPPGSSDS